MKHFSSLLKSIKKIKKYKIKKKNGINFVKDSQSREGLMQERILVALLYKYMCTSAWEENLTLSQSILDNITVNHITTGAGIMNNKYGWNIFDFPFIIIRI